MSSDLLSTLNNLKNKLNLLESQVFIETSSSNVINEDQYVKRLPEKLKMLENSQNSMIQLNIRGELYLVSKNLCNDCFYDNIISKELSTNSSTTEIFLDFDRKILKEILNIMRYFNITLSSKEKKEPYKIFVKNQASADFFQLELLNFFADKCILNEIVFEF